MPNVTYITFKKWPNYWYSLTNYSIKSSTTINNLTTNSSTTNKFPSNVILLIEEQNENVQKLFNGNKYGMALMISALLLILIGCCCACNWFNQNSKIRTIIPRNKNILLGHGKIRSRNRRRRRCTELSGINYNDVVTDNSECNNNNNNNNNGLSERIHGNEHMSVQQIRRYNGISDHVERGNEDRTNPSADQPDVLRRYDLDVESLPSYTLCSGLPSYDSALEEFRKAGIILTTTPSVVKIFENTSKEHLIGGNIFDNNDLTTTVTASPTTPSSATNNLVDNNNDTNLNSCKCGGNSPSTILGDINYDNNSSSKQSSSIESIIELSPEQLNMLSEKRLSLQIAFNSSIRRIQPLNRGIDLRREVLRSHEIPAAIHRSSSLRLIPRHLINNTETNDDTRIPSKLLQLNMNRHRGSIV